jgi:hypothetical protein
MAEERLVVALVDDLPSGLAINAGALLGITLGRLFPQIVGPDVVDASGTTHPGISTRPLPILKTSAERLAELAGKARTDPRVTIIDLTQAAQQTRTYAEYSQRLAGLPTEEQRVIGVALHGPHATLTSLTGDLPLYR